jgi:hypothetical protein
MAATCAILTTLTRRAPRHDLLGGTEKSPASTATTRTILANSWDVHSTESLRSTLAWLRDVGHRAGHTPSPTDGLGPGGLLAWDLCRLVSVAGWGYVADYISEDEAWSAIAPAAATLQRTYVSWADLGQAYTRGAYKWDQAAGADCATRTQALLQDASSPWRTLPWSTDLGAAPLGAAPLGAPPAVNLAAGTVNVGDHQLRVKINHQAPGDYLKRQVENQVSGAIWSGIIGVVIVVVAILLLGGIGLYVYLNRDAKSPATATAAKWNGKTPFTCDGNDQLTLTGVTANLSGTAVTARGNCQLTLSGVNLTAGVGIDASANAKVIVTGGSITASANSVVASGNATVSCTGTKVSGKSKASGGAKVTGAN